MQWSVGDVSDWKSAALDTLPNCIRGFSDASDTLMDQIIGLLLDYTINMIIFLETHNIIDYA
jgi:hypothetical protein